MYDSALPSSPPARQNARWMNAATEATEPAPVCRGNVSREAGPQRQQAGAQLDARETVRHQRGGTCAGR